MTVQNKRLLIAFFLAMIAFGLVTRPPHAQETIDKTKLEWAHAILRDAHDAVKKHYYDPAYHGLNLDAQYRFYDKKIDSATSFNECLRFVAAFLEGLRDSHTDLIPPDRPYRFDYGF
jgi:Tricorn protease C1 domain